MFDPKINVIFARKIGFNLKLNFGFLFSTFHLSQKQKIEFNKFVNTLNLGEENFYFLGGALSDFVCQSYFADFPSMCYDHL